MKIFHNHNCVLPKVENGQGGGAGVGGYLLHCKSAVYTNAFKI